MEMARSHPTEAFLYHHQASFDPESLRVLTCDQAFFFSQRREEEKKESLIQLLVKSSAAPLLKYLSALSRMSAMPSDKRD